jgi:hypothetical protein
MRDLARYEWEDILVESQALFLIKKQPVCSALLLARQINWCPRDGKRPSLRWKNKLAAESVGIPRSTLMLHLKVLKAAGFLVSVKGNLAPTLPKNHEEIREAFKQMVSDLAAADNRGEVARRRSVLTQFGTAGSSIQIKQSNCCDPFTEYSCTEDLSTEDSFIEKTDASHPALWAVLR